MYDLIQVTLEELNITQERLLACIGRKKLVWVTNPLEGQHFIVIGPSFSATYKTLKEAITTFNLL